MDWETPNDLFQKIDKRFHFTLDVCASDNNAKCKQYFTKHDNGLKQSWGGQICWMNPPYGSEIGKWMRKARDEACLNNATVVCLVPARLDARWFQDTVFGDNFTAAEVIAIKGRVSFIGSLGAAPFTSCFVVFTPNHAGCPILSTVDQYHKDSLFINKATIDAWDDL